MNRFFSIEAKSLSELIVKLNEITVDDVYARHIITHKENGTWFSIFDRAVLLTTDVITFNEPESKDEPYTCMCTNTTKCYECLRRSLYDEFMNNPIRLDIKDDD